MQINFTPKFFFYSNTDMNIFIQNSYNVLIDINKYIFEVKRKMNYFLNLYNFILIYFYIGNYFIKNKLQKTLNNLLYIHNNYYVRSDTRFNLLGNIKNFINDIKKKKKYNLNKALFSINNHYYFPLEILKVPYFYFLFIPLYFNLYLKMSNFFRLANLNIMRTFQNHIIKKTLC